MLFQFSKHLFVIVRRLPNRFIGTSKCERFCHKYEFTDLFGNHLTVTYNFDKLAILQMLFRNKVYQCNQNPELVCNLIEFFFETLTEQENLTNLLSISINHSQNEKTKWILNGHPSATAKPPQSCQNELVQAKVVSSPNVSGETFGLMYD